MQVRGGRFAVTGGAGFIGSNLVRALLDGGAARVAVLDNLVRGRARNLEDLAGDRRLEVLLGDLREGWPAEAVVRDCDAVYHLAALRIPRCQERPDECLDSMVRGTYSLLDAAARHAVKKVIYASSVAVYGQPARLPVDEDAPAAPTTFYGAAKAAGEGLLRAFGARGAFQWTILRCFNVYGPRMDHAGPHTEVLVRWMRALRCGRPPKVFGDGETTLDLAHIDDVVTAYLAALAPRASGGVYNIGAGTQVSLAALARVLAAAAGSGLEPEFAAAPPAVLAPRMEASVERARRELGFVPRVPLSAGLASLWRWFCEVDTAAADAGNAEVAE